MPHWLFGHSRLSELTPTVEVRTSHVMVPGCHDVMITELVNLSADGHKMVKLDPQLIIGYSKSFIDYEPENWRRCA